MVFVVGASEGDGWRAREREPIIGAAGSRGRAPGGGQGATPPEAERFSALGHRIDIEN